jgi:hypothetical protein
MLETYDDVEWVQVQKSEAERLKDMAIESGFSLMWPLPKTD